MKNLYRSVALCGVLGLVGLASASHAVASTCTYRCQNTTTGQTTIVTAGASEAACCGGTVTCPSGSTYVGTIGYNNGRGLMRCAF